MSQSKSNSQDPMSTAERTGTPQRLEKAATAESARLVRGMAPMVVAYGDASLMRSGAGLIAADGATQMTDSGAGVIVCDGDVELTNGGATLIVANRDMQIKNGGAVTLVAGHDLQVTNGGAALLLAGGNIDLVRGRDSGSPITAMMASRQASVENSFVGLVLAGRADLHGSQVLLSLPIGALVDVFVNSALSLADRLLSLLEPPARGRS